MKKTEQNKKITEKGINKTMEKDFKVQMTEEVKKAIGVLEKTASVINKIRDEKNDEAKEELAKIIGELEIILTKYPDLSLIPVDIKTEIVEAIVDKESAENVIKVVKEAIDEGYYQTAKELLNGLTSAYIIYYYMLPMLTYPEAMKVAASLLDEGKVKEAETILIRSLNTLAIQKTEIPLPILRAEEYIKLAKEMINSDKEDKKAETKTLLENAEYQLELAEVMGYGKRDKEYKTLYDAIKSLKKSVGDDEDTDKLFDELSEKIKTFKERLFFKKNNNN